MIFKKNSVVNLEELLKEHEEDYKIFSEKLILASEECESFVNLLKSYPPERIEEFKVLLFEDGTSS